MGFFGSAPSPSLGKVAKGFKLTTTAATPVKTYTPSVDMALLLQVSLGVIVAATTVTLTASWTDPNTGAETYTWENAANVPVGSRLELPASIMAAANSPVTITATAGTANQVFVTGSIERQV